MHGVVLEVMILHAEEGPLYQKLGVEMGWTLLNHMSSRLNLS